MVELYTPEERRFRERNEIVVTARNERLGPEWVKAQYVALDERLRAEGELPRD